MKYDQISKWLGSLISKYVIIAGLFESKLFSPYFYSQRKSFLSSMDYKTFFNYPDKTRHLKLINFYDDLMSQFLKENPVQCELDTKGSDFRTTIKIYNMYILFIFNCIILLLLL